MTIPAKASKGLGACAAALLLAGLGGCADGIELQGGVFDALGVSTTALAGKRADTQKVAARPGLVIPPDPDRLPVPGEENVAASAQAWPVDPDQKRRTDRATLERQHKEFCDKAIADEKVRRTDTIPQGPLGSCSPSALRSIMGSSNPLDKL